MEIKLNEVEVRAILAKIDPLGNEVKKLLASYFGCAPECITVTGVVEERMSELAETLNNFFKAGWNIQYLTNAIQTRWREYFYTTLGEDLCRYIFTNWEVFCPFLREAKTEPLFTKTGNGWKVSAGSLSVNLV